LFQLVSFLSGSDDSDFPGKIRRVEKYQDVGPAFGWFPGVWNLYSDVSEHSVQDGTERVFRNVGI